MVIEELRSVREAAARAEERGHCAWQRDGGSAFPLDFEQNIVCLFIRWPMRKYARCAAYSVTLESECSFDVALCADRTRFSTKGLLRLIDTGRIGRHPPLFQLAFLQIALNVPIWSR